MVNSFPLFYLLLQILGFYHCACVSDQFVDAVCTVSVAIGGGSVDGFAYL